jgi:hypothetical protein
MQAYRKDTFFCRSCSPATDLSRRHRLTPSISKAQSLGLIGLGQKSSRDSPTRPRLGKMLEQFRFRRKGKLAVHRAQLAGPAVSLVLRFR